MSANPYSSGGDWEMAVKQQRGACSETCRDMRTESSELSKNTAWDGAKDLKTIAA